MKFVSFLRSVFALLCIVASLFFGVAQASILSDGFVKCADDGGTCTPPAGSRYWVRYGSGDLFVTYTSTMITIPCRDTIETGQTNGFAGPFRTPTPRICSYLAATGSVAPFAGLGFVRNGTNGTFYWPICADGNYCTTVTNPGDSGGSGGGSAGSMADYEGNGEPNGIVLQSMFAAALVLIAWVIARG